MVTSDEPDDLGFTVVHLPQTADSVSAAIRFLVKQLVTTGQLPAEEAETVIERMLRREHLGSTGIGRGLAIPHTTNEVITKAAVVVGRASAPLDWQAVDAEPVHLVCLLVAPGVAGHANLRALEALARRLRRDFGRG